jgi:hypothetical protein
VAPIPSGSERSKSRTSQEVVGCPRSSSRNAERVEGVAIKKGAASEEKDRVTLEVR